MKLPGLTIYLGINFVLLEDWSKVQFNACLCQIYQTNLNVIFSASVTLPGSNKARSVLRCLKKIARKMLTTGLFILIIAGCGQQCECYHFCQYWTFLID